MLLRCIRAAAMPNPPKARQISRANNGDEPLLGLSPLVLVGGGVADWAGVPVSPWKDSNGVSVTRGVAVSPWKDSNGVPVGSVVGLAVILGVGLAVMTGVGLGVILGLWVMTGVGLGVILGLWVMTGVGLADGPLDGSWLGEDVAFWQLLELRLIVVVQPWLPVGSSQANTITCAVWVTKGEPAEKALA